MAVHQSNPLQPDFWRALHKLGPVPLESTEKALFQAGDPSNGLYLVEEGEVGLYLEQNSRRIESKASQALEIAGPGSVLGMSETMTGGDYKLTAETLPGARVSFIERTAFLKVLRQDHELCIHIVRMLSEDLHRLYYHCRCSAPSGSRSPRAS